jgi:hypothetical protein
LYRNSRWIGAVGWNALVVPLWLRDDGQVIATQAIQARLLAPCVAIGRVVRIFDRRLLRAISHLRPNHGRLLLEVHALRMGKRQAQRQARDAESDRRQDESDHRGRSYFRIVAAKPVLHARKNMLRMMVDEEDDEMLTEETIGSAG